MIGQVSFIFDLSIIFVFLLSLLNRFLFFHIEIFNDTSRMLEDIFHGNGLQSLCSLIGIESSGGKKMLSKRIVDYVFQNCGDPPATNDFTGTNDHLHKVLPSKKRKNDSLSESSIGRMSLRSTKPKKTARTSTCTSSFSSTSVYPLISESSFVNFSKTVNQGKSVLYHPITMYIFVSILTFLHSVSRSLLQFRISTFALEDVST